MASFTFFDLIDEVFEKVKEPLSEREIWDKAIELGIDKKVGSVGKTPWKTISARIYVNMRDNSNSKYVKVGKRPARFYLRKYQEEEIPSEIEKKLESKEQSEKKLRFNERDLHPLLVKFVNEDQHFKAYSRTIYHENSLKKQKGENKWIHPDIVGVYFPFDDFDDLTTEVQKSLSVNSIKLYSFELKVNLNFSNLREYYFQAVSNSSWANEGYLVCIEIKEDSELMNELQRLNSAFGIGIIKLNSEVVSQSEILLPARDRSDLDWTTIDRLIGLNDNFKRFFLDITEDLKIGKVKSKYDVVKTDDEMDIYLTSKGFVI